jgi:hypothetical protein
MNPDGSFPENGNVPEEKNISSLKEGTDNTEAALMPRDSNWMFVCWKISDKVKRELEAEKGPEFMKTGRLTVRVNDVTLSQTFDVEVLPEAGSWYINVPEGGHEYFCEIGYKDSSTFRVLTKTNKVRLPLANLTGLIEEKLQSVSGNIEKLFGAGVDKAGAASENLARRWEMLRSVFSQNETGSNTASTQPDIQPAQEKNERKSPLWIAADCELVVFGATDKDAEVTVGGRKIYINPDGTFTARFSFPDGVTRLQVKAISADKKQEKSVKIEASRKTEIKN